MPTKLKLILLVALAVLMTSCGKDEPVVDPFANHKYNLEDVKGAHVRLEGLTIDNLPQWDCSTSTQPLEALLVCGLLGLDYSDSFDVVEGTYSMSFDASKLTVDEIETLRPKLRSSTTHGAFVNLIDGEVDIAVCSRALSRAEREYAQEKGVTIAQTPIALDGFVFIVNETNPVNMLTVEQIRQIYTANITNWKDLGGNDDLIQPFIRDANSGSQEKMETLVMDGLTMIDWPQMIGHNMMDPFLQVSWHPGGIAYTLYYYTSVMARQSKVKMLGLNGVAATKENIINGTYPFITEVVIAVRNDINRNSWAWKCYELIATGQENGMINATGYVAGKLNN